MTADSGNSAVSRPHVEKPTDRAWFRSATVYQIYPASFCDHADNGHGTLKGITFKLDYLKSLGVDIVWLSPIFKSPQADMGYDISDYRDIHRPYGTLDDWEELKNELHARGMKLVMDLVVNHSSDEHAWFLESKKDKTNPKADFYIWRDPKYNDKGERIPPNNWRSLFGAGSAWEWVEERQQYYLHLFLKEQPDLNWENAEVRKEVYDMMHWWLKKGVDGFRMDVINFIAKAPGLPDAPTTQPGRDYQFFGDLSINRPEVHGFLKEMNREVLSHYDCFAVGECPGDQAVSEFSGYSIPANEELQMVFHFHHLDFDKTQLKQIPNWKLSDFKKTFITWQTEMWDQGGWNSNYLENHDQPRLISRIACDDPSERAQSGKMCAMFHTTLGGTIFVYEGQEIGMCNVPRDWPEEEYKDIEVIQYLEGERDYRRREGKSDDVSDVLKEVRQGARDNGRTPVQWDSSENAGFSKAKPWMRLHDDYTQGWNVADQQKDPNSVWHFWQKMLKLRKQYDSVIYGKFIPLDAASEQVFAYIRDDKTISQRILVILNMARGKDEKGLEIEWQLPADVDVSGAKLLITNGPHDEGSGLEKDGKIKLGKWEGRVYLL